MKILRLIWLVTGSWYAAVVHTRAMWLMLLVEEPVMRLPLQLIKEKYGGVNQKYWDSMGVSAEDLDAIRAAMLEAV